MSIEIPFTSIVTPVNNNNNNNNDNRSQHTLNNLTCIICYKHINKNINEHTCPARAYIITPIKITFI